MAITDKEFDEKWERAKARDAQEEAEWNALPTDEKNRRREMFDDGFAERVSDDPTGGNVEEETDD